jgi:hypothetical protein
MANPTITFGAAWTALHEGLRIGLRRKLRQVGEGVLDLRTMYLATVA